MDYSDQTLDAFLASIASKRVTPAGGTATAVVGAIGAALCEMVCIHTIDKDGYGAVAPEMREARDGLRQERSHLLGLATADARVVADLFPPSGDDLDQSALKQSIGVPLTTADACLTVLEFAVEVAANGTENALVDAATGVTFAHSALRASVFTARSNVDLVSDPSFVARIEERAADIEASGHEAHEGAMERIYGRK